MNAEALLRKWERQIPKDGARCEDAVAVMQYLGMSVIRRSTGHRTGSHQRLVGSVPFPQGVLTLNCHAFGREGTAHPAGIRDIVKAARILEEDD